MAASCRARVVRGAGLGHPAIPTARLFHGCSAWSQSRYTRDRSHSQCTCLAHRLSARHALESRLVRTLAIGNGFGYLLASAVSFSQPDSVAVGLGTQY